MSATKTKASKKGRASREAPAAKSAAKSRVPAEAKREKAAKKATYSDGHPLDEVQFLEAKIILKGDRFVSLDSFKEFSTLVKRAADNADIDFSRKGFKDLRPQIREVLFLDTEDFRLYNNAFILRRRVNYVDGFAVGDPEIVCKFRHPDEHTAAEMDIRPKISGDYRIKFKAEILPLKDQIGGLRSLYSHNVEFGLSQEHEGELIAMTTLHDVFPALQALQTRPDEKVELVNQTSVEEVLLDIGMLDFGKGVSAKSNVAVWRTRGDEKQLVGEFGFQCKFQRRDELRAVALKRLEQFFVSLQHVAQDWLALGTTKTGAVYRLKGNPPRRTNSVPRG